MPLKLKRTEETHPANYTTVNGAFAHFLATWYDKPADPVDTLEIRNAFYAGATYLRDLVRQSSQKAPAEIKAHMTNLYQELDDEAARNQFEPWIDKYLDRGQAPSPAMNLPGVAPAPAPAPVLGPDKVGEGQDQTAPQPMMWTIGMVQEFQAGYEGARAAGAPTFPFKGRTFRTADAPPIIAHLKTIFANDQPKPQPQNPNL